VFAQQGWPEQARRVRPSCASYARGRNEPLSKMASQIIEDDLRAAPAVDRTTTQTL
jgi:hypothetical protein